VSNPDGVDWAVSLRTYWESYIQLLQFHFPVPAFMLRAIARTSIDQPETPIDSHGVRIRAGQISRNWQDFHRTPVKILPDSGEKFQQLRKTCTGVRCFQVRPRGLYRFHRSATEHALTEFPQSLVRNDWESVSPVPIRCAGHRSDVQISRTSVVLILLSLRCIVVYLFS